MRLGYNTNGLAHHRLPDAIALLAEFGFQSVALTLDTSCLDPYGDRNYFEEQLSLTRRLLDRFDMTCVIETGTRYLLNPKKKHDPTLMDPDPARRALRIDFLLRAINIASVLKAQSVSFWSGALSDDVGEEEGLDRLTDALRPVLNAAETFQMRLAFEPEPGMFIDTFEQFNRLDQRIRHPLFDLTVDLGHVHCIESPPISDHLKHWGPRIANVHIEDMNRGVHEHLMFGEGTMDFPPILRTLIEMGYQGGVHVELSRHSHMAVQAVEQSARFLNPWFPQPH